MDRQANFGVTDSTNYGTVVRLGPQKRVHCTIKPMVEVLVPQTAEANVDVVRLIPQERMQ